MNIEQLSEICIEFRSVTTDIKWEDHLCFNVGGKMFCVVSLSQVPTTASFKATEEDFEKLVDRPGLSPAPYLARYNWVHIDDIRG